MLGDLSDWILAALPWKVEVGCLVAAVVLAGFVLLWVYFG